MIVCLIDTIVKSYICVTLTLIVVKNPIVVIVSLYLPVIQN